MENGADVWHMEKVKDEADRELMARRHSENDHELTTPFSSTF